MIEYIEKFSTKKLENVGKIGRSSFLINNELKDVIGKVGITPESAGVFLGDEKKGFNPSLALFERLSEMSDKKVFVDKKAEWLFLCGRDVFEKSVESGFDQKGLVLVQNEKDENLGLGKIHRNLVKNIIDRGDFLRREK
ncbi:hypothetical protein GOV08_05050 [Candidatus Woesearchaeota archaeon]|nr:hypothetical protein [Candidatus Woesearchaeota archaeon]